LSSNLVLLLFYYY